jgi:subtilisin family serine protease
MKRIVFPMLALLAVSFYGLAQSKQGDPRNPTRIIIKFRPGAQLLAQARAAAPKSLMESRSLAEAPQSSAPLASMLSASGIVRLRAVKPDAGLEPLAAGIERLFIADLGPDASAGAAVRSLTGNPDIEYVEPDAVVRITSVQANAAGQSQRGTGRVPLVPNDPKFSLQWSLQNTGQTLTLDDGRISVTGTPGADINALAAWDISAGSSNIVLAVLDSGIALNHPEFAGRIVTGYDFVHQRTNTIDDQGHGTAVASVAAATGGNGILMAGVDWKCTILPVIVIDATGAGNYSNIISGLTYAADHGARVINLSAAGTAASNALRDAVNYAANKGAILVASMGNDNTESPYYPAAYANVIAVGATNSKDQRAAPFSCDPKGGSNYSSRLDFVAPGDLMVGLSYSDPTAITAWCGTSLSAPVVSGTVSLILSVNPALNYDQVFAVLKAGARDQVGSSDEDTQGWDKYCGWGRIDAYRSLLAARGTSLFSHVALGAGYTTIFAFLNTGSVPVDANLSLTDKTGVPLDVSLSGPSISPDISESGNRVLASTLGFTVPPGGTRYLSATRAGGGDPKTG